MKASIVLTTHNRADQTLAAALESVLAQSLSPDNHEVLVVDSASTDHTRKVVQEICARAPNARYLHETMPGVSRARNRGWQEARGDTVCYMDDDEVADEDWAKTIVGAFSTGNPDLACVGGPVRPLWERPPPPWVEKLHGCIGIIDLGADPILTEPGHADSCFIGGGNAGFRRSALEKVGGFRESMGKRGAQPLLGEDTMMLRDLARHGFRALYHPGVIVHHHVPAARMTRRYLLRWNYRSGQAVGRIRLMEERPSTDECKRMIRRRLADLRIHTGETLRHAPRYVREAAFFYRICMAASVAGNLRAWLAPPSNRESP